MSTPWDKINSCWKINFLFSRFQPIFKTRYTSGTWLNSTSHQDLNLFYSTWLPSCVQLRSSYLLQANSPIRAFTFAWIFVLFVLSYLWVVLVIQTIDHVHNMMDMPFLEIFTNQKFFTVDTTTSELTIEKGTQLWSGYIPLKSHKSQEGLKKK